MQKKLAQSPHAFRFPFPPSPIECPRKQRKRPPPPKKETQKFPRKKKNQGIQCNFFFGVLLKAEERERERSPKKKFEPLFVFLFDDFFSLSCEKCLCLFFIFFFFAFAEGYAFQQR